MKKKHKMNLYRIAKHKYVVASYIITASSIPGSYNIRATAHHFKKRVVGLKEVERFVALL